MRSQKTNWYDWFVLMFSEFMIESASKSYYQLVNVYDCKKTGFTKAVIKLSERHTIEKKIEDVMSDDNLLEGLDHKTIRTLTYIATVERLKPEYAVVAQRTTNQTDEYILELRSIKGTEMIVKSATALSKDGDLIAKLHPAEANRIGYLAGVRETVREYQMLSNLRK